MYKWDWGKRHYANDCSKTSKKTDKVVRDHNSIDELVEVFGMKEGWKRIVVHSPVYRHEEELWILFDAR